MMRSASSHPAAFLLVAVVKAAPRKLSVPGDFLFLYILFYFIIYIIFFLKNLKKKSKIVFTLPGGVATGTRSLTGT